MITNQKRAMVLWLILATLCGGLLALGQPLTYDTDRRVPFLSGQGYERDEYHWWIQNTGQDSRLFLNGNYLEQEGGTNDVRISESWLIQSNGISIGVVDINNPHGHRVTNTAQLVSNGDVLLSNSLRVFPDDIAAGISNFVSGGIKIVVVTEGSGNHVGTSNACAYALSSNTLVICALPNFPVNVDLVPDYPSSWAHLMPNIVPVAMTDRTGNLYASGYGTNSVAAPGRNIVAAGTYSSGTSYATPIVAGCLSLLMDRFPNQSVPAYRQALVVGADVISNTRRINAMNMLLAPIPSVSISGSNLTVSGLSEWIYSIERTEDFQSWGLVTNVYGGECQVVGEGFYRAKVL